MMKKAVSAIAILAVATFASAADSPSPAETAQVHALYEYCGLVKTQEIKEMIRDHVYDLSREKGGQDLYKRALEANRKNLQFASRDTKADADLRRDICPQVQAVINLELDAHRKVKELADKILANEMAKKQN